MHPRPRVIVPVILTVAALTLVLGLGRHADRLQIDGGAFTRIEHQLNTYTASAQGHVALDLTERGEVVVAWDSRRQQAGTYGVYARWIDARGTLSGDVETLNLAVRGSQIRPAVAAGTEGPWFAWTSQEQDGRQGAIIARTEGDEVLVNTTTDGDQSDVTVARLADGGLVAMWTTPTPELGGRRVVYRVFNADRTPRTPELTADETGPYRDEVPTASGGGGGFVAAWTRVGLDGKNEGVFGRRFDETGAPAGPAFRISAPGRDAIEPTIAADGAGRFVVGWLRLDPHTEYDPMIRFYATDGTPRSPELPTSSSLEGWQSGIAVACAPDGRMVVAWNEITDGGHDADIRARFFQPTGQPAGEAFRVTGHTEGRQMLTVASGARRLAYGADGRVAVAWEGNAGGGDRSAAAVTVLLPTRPDLLGDLATGVRQCGHWLAGLTADDPSRLDLAAAPHVPPILDPDPPSEDLDLTAQIQARGIGFEGFTFSGLTPPDPHISVGPDDVVLVINNGVSARGKDGALHFSETTTQFWAEVAPTGLVFDPETLYDPFEGRFMVMANERSGSQSYTLLAISETSDPSDPTAWYRYRFNVTASVGADIDSPNFAVDPQAIYISADFFGPDRYFILIVDKASVINGGLPLLTEFLWTGTQSFGIASQYSADAPRMYMIEAFESEPENEVRLWAINDPLETPTLQSTLLSVDTYYEPADIPSAGTSQRASAFEARFWSCMYRNGSLWACHHISEDNVPRRTVARWYEIEMNGWPTSGSEPTLRQSGTVDPGGNVYLSFNSIFADEEGNASMVYARSSTMQFFAMGRAHRLADDALGFMGNLLTIKESTSTNTGGRWGDYSGVVADPFATGRVFWGHHEFKPAGSWRTWVQSYDLGDPVAVAAVTSPLDGRLAIGPNPTAGPASFSFALTVPGEVRIEVFDVGGRLVRALEAGALGAQEHRVEWDGRTAGGAPVADGVYMTRVMVDGVVRGTSQVVVNR